MLTFGGAALTFNAATGKGVGAVGFVLGPLCLIAGVVLIAAYLTARRNGGVDSKEDNPLEDVSPGPKTYWRPI